MFIGGWGEIAKTQLGMIVRLAVLCVLDPASRVWRGDSIRLLVCRPDQMARFLRTEKVHQVWLFEVRLIDTALRQASPWSRLESVLWDGVDRFLRIAFNGCVSAMPDTPSQGTEFFHQTDRYGLVCPDRSYVISLGFDQNEDS